MRESKLDNGTEGEYLRANPSDAFAVVVAHYNEFITKDLLGSVIAGLSAQGVESNQIEVFDVPGAMELPVATKWLAESDKFAAIICIGSVIRGATTHYEVVINTSSIGVSQVALQFGVPVIYGVLTTENIEQAIERSEPKMGNKGLEFATSAIKMANLKRVITG